MQKISFAFNCAFTAVFLLLPELVPPPEHQSYVQFFYGAAFGLGVACMVGLAVNTAPLPQDDKIPDK